jgi:hypothetical protein
VRNPFGVESKLSEAKGRRAILAGASRSLHWLSGVMQAEDGNQFSIVILQPELK